MKTDSTAIEDTIVQVRCIGQTLVLMGEGLHTPGDPTGAAFIRLGQDLLAASEKLQPVIHDLLAMENLAKAEAA